MHGLVIPCFNEAARLAVESFAAAAKSGLGLILVDDGSSDETLHVLQRIKNGAGPHVHVLSLPRNSGKGEAVRSGMLLARELKWAFAGYWDADLSTPWQEAEKFAEILRKNPQLQVVMGARLRSLGRGVARSSLRHYAGRIIATFVSIVVRAGVYDSQCGAKLFRMTPEVVAAISRPFAHRWLFDVEILLRLARESELPLATVVYEHALPQWRDTGESKVKWYNFFGALLALARMDVAYNWRPSRASHRVEHP